MAEDQKTLRPARPTPTGPVTPPPRITFRILAESLQNLVTEDGSPLRRE